MKSKIALWFKLQCNHVTQFKIVNVLIYILIFSFSLCWLPTKFLEMDMGIRNVTMNMIPFMKQYIIQFTRKPVMSTMIRNVMWNTSTPTRQNTTRNVTLATTQCATLTTPQSIKRNVPLRTTSPARKPTQWNMNTSTRRNVMSIMTNSAMVTATTRQ